jgi:hypothetical protein
MGVLKTIFTEFLALFVDDGSLALAILGWLLIFGWVLRPLLYDPLAGSAILVGGLLVILVANVLKSARPK